MNDSMPASLPTVLAACPEVAVPMTRMPSRSRASRTVSSTVVLPVPAMPTTTSRQRPLLQIPTTADSWELVSGRPSRRSVETIARSSRTTDTGSTRRAA